MLSQLDENYDLNYIQFVSVFTGSVDVFNPQSPCLPRYTTSSRQDACNRSNRKQESTSNAKSLAGKAQRVYHDLCAVGGSRDVSTTPGPVNVDVVTFWVLLASVLWLDSESVSTKVVTLSLQEVSWKVLGSVSVVEAKGCAESRCWDTPESTLADNVSPSWLSMVNGLGEEIVEQQILKVGVAAVGIGDVLQKDGSDNATTTPHQSNRWLVQLPLVLLCGILNQHETLGIGDNLGGIQSLLKVGQELFLVSVELWWFRSREYL